MKIKIIAFILLLSTVIIGCNEKAKYPTDKRYWTSEDYSTVIYNLTYGLDPDDKLPTFDDPTTSAVIKKLTDHENYRVILMDSELGLKHKNEIASKFFDHISGMQDLYSVIDRKDMYVYEKEMIEVSKFSLGLQLLYFKLGNDNIIKKADDPNSTHVRNIVNDNIQTLISNYLLYLDKVKNEEALSMNGKSQYAEGINEYFSKLIETFPKSDFYSLEHKLKLLKEKTKTEEIQSAMQSILDKINSLKPKEEESIEE